MEASEKKSKINDDISDDIKIKIASFPSMPQSVVKLRTLLKEEDLSLNEIENILRQDPGFSANILRLANSSYFGLSSKVSSLKQAVMLLGVKRFEQIAVSAAMNKIMDKSVEGYDLSPGELWNHSIAVATTAEAIAKFLNIDEPDNFFIPALIHDMGKLVLSGFVKKSLKQIESIVSKKIPFCIAEHMVLGTDHAEIGALILKKWMFPKEIVNAVRWHHDPECKSLRNKHLNNFSMHSDIVYLSNLIFQSTCGGDSDNKKFEMPSSKVLNRVGINIERFTAFFEKAHSWNNKLNETLSFN